MGPKRHFAYCVAGKIWATTILVLTGLYPKKSGINPNPRRQYIYTFNHQSQLDILVALAILPPGFLFVAKESLFKVPFIGFSMRRSGYISIKRENAKQAAKTLQVIKDRINEGVSVLIFPEGTRTEDGSIGKVKRGSILIAFQTRIPLMPVIINPLHQILPKGKILFQYKLPRVVYGDELIFDWDNLNRQYTIDAAAEIEKTFKELLTSLYKK
jgi:1-acyl-sn-glycerol-3-phosphate acyltransferase